MNTYQIYISSVWRKIQKLFKSGGEGFLFAGKFLVVVLLVVGVKEGSAQEIDQVTGQVKPVHNYKLYEAVEIETVVDLIELIKYPKVNFAKYPRGRYKVDFTKIKRIQVGDKLSDEILDLPLWVVNDIYGRDTLTLRTEMDKEWLILDFWTEWCPPCIKSMNNWERIVKKQQNNITLLGVYSDLYPYKAVIEARKRGYESVQVIGASMAVLMALFQGDKASLGPAAWIKNGQFFGISTSEGLTDYEYTDILSGKIMAIPTHAVYKGRL